MNIRQKELLQNIPRYESHKVEGGTLYIFHQTLHPLKSPKALVNEFRRQKPEDMDPTQMQGEYLRDGDRAEKGYVKHIRIGSDDVVIKRVRHSIKELRQYVPGKGERDRKLHLQASLPIRQLITYFDTVEEAKKIVGKRGQKMEEVWPLEVPLAYFQAEDRNEGYDWLVFDYIPPCIPPKPGTIEVNSWVEAGENRFPENLLFQAGAEILEDVEGRDDVVTGNPKDGYRRKLVDTERIFRFAPTRR